MTVIYNHEKGSLLSTYHSDLSSNLFFYLHSPGNEVYHNFKTSLEQVCINSELHLQTNMTFTRSHTTFTAYTNRLLFTSKTAVAWSCDVNSVRWLVHSQTRWRRWKQSACVATREYRFFTRHKILTECFTVDLMNDDTSMKGDWGRDYDVREFSPHSWQWIWGWWEQILCATR